MTGEDLPDLASGARRGEAAATSPTSTAERLADPVGDPSLVRSTEAPSIGRGSDAASVPVGVPGLTPAGAGLLERSFDAAPVPSVVVDGVGRVALINAMARQLLRLSASDVGRPLQDLEMSCHPVGLQSSLEVAIQERRPVVHREVDAMVAPGESRTFDVEVRPVVDAAGEPVGVSITFDDVTHHRRREERLVRSERQFGVVYEELLSTNEELESANDELHAMIEELEATNEELLSTNEELEALNAELQSTIEELRRTDGELRTCRQWLDEASGVLESVLGGLQQAVVVVDTDFTVQVWNEGAADVWGLRRDEAVGRNLLGLDIGLPLHELGVAVRTAFEGVASSAACPLPARDRSGRRICCWTLVSPRRDGEGAIAGALLVMRPDLDGEVC